MARNSSAITVWFQYVATRLAAMGLTALDIQTALRAATALGRVAYRVDRRHRDRARQTLTWAFPQLDRDRIEHLVQRAFEHLVELVAEVFHAPRLIHADSWPYRVQLHNVGGTLELLSAGRPVLLITGHLGNWEILGYLLALLGYDADVIARPLDNRLINHWLLSIRERHGMRIITKWNATDRMIDTLRRGGSLGLLADQNAGNKGLFVPFFGRLASTHKSIGLLAMNQRVPIICGYARRLGHGYRYEMGIADIIHPHDWADQPDPLYYITARYTRAIETMIRACPEQYLWMHRRWKSRPRHERQNKPMPAPLRRQIEQLPWMDQATLDRLADPPRVFTPHALT